MSMTGIKSETAYYLRKLADKIDGTRPGDAEAFEAGLRVGYRQGRREGDHLAPAVADALRAEAKR